MSTQYVPRSRLGLERIAAYNTTIVDLCAPQGYGRTQLLAAWFHEAVALNFEPLWLSLEGVESVAQLAECLTCSVLKSGAGVMDPSFATWVGDSLDPMETLTGWILEVQRRETNCLLLLDDVRDDGPLTEALTFLIANAPGNLRIAAATRPGCQIFNQPLFWGTTLKRLTAEDLRFTVQEAEALAQQTHGVPDALGRHFHDLTDGWPLGLNIALMSDARGETAPSFKVAASDALDRYFHEHVAPQMDASDVDLLAALSHCDALHPALSEVVTSKAHSPLGVLADTTPMVLRAGSEDWFRLQPAARPYLKQRFASWPEKRRQDTARKAAEWYASQGMFADAAKLAKLGDCTQLALDFAEKAVRDLTLDGQGGEVVRWIESFSQEQLAQRPEFWLAGAWAYSNMYQHDKAKPFLELLNKAAVLPDHVRLEVQLIKASIAGHTDDLNSLDVFRDFWSQTVASPTVDQGHIAAALLAARHLLRGEPDDARKLLETAKSRAERTEATAMLDALLDAYDAMTYLWEGKPRLAYDRLLLALEDAKRKLSARNHAVLRLHAILSFCATELGEMDAARQWLSNRLVQIERFAAPDTLIFGYLAAARLSEEDQRLDLAQAQLERMVSIGRARSLPRVEAVGRRHLVQLFVRTGQLSLAQAEIQRLEGLLSSLPNSSSPSLCNLVRLSCRMAQATLPKTIATMSPRQAADEACTLAKRLHRGSDYVIARGRLGRARLDEGDMKGKEDVQDSLVTARAWGLNRVLNDHDRQRSASTHQENPPQFPRQDPLRDPVQSGALTQREYDVLQGLAASLSNKEIALTLGLSDETIKWHLKNLFRKLEAADRKIAVARARMLRLI
jgi:LuxR family maltose regulon positive regulatory protein